MKLSFDKFKRYELPQVTLCNPNSRATEVDGKITITDTVGVLSNPKGMNLKLNFNAPHELSFDYYRHKSSDPIKQSFYDKIYEAIQTDRYIYLTDIGYFTISGVADSDKDNIDKKSISLKSCEENEFATAEGLHLKEGTYYLHTENNDGLIDLFLPKTAGWTIGFVDPSLLTKPYFVEETEVDNGYNFLYTTIQDMFECIVEPDIIKRTISVYSRVYYAERHLTDIHIAKYNLLKHKTVEENDEDKYTALNVQGKDENLEIRAVNPTGKNIIYNFEPRYSWMSSALQEAVVKWQEKCESVEDEYLTLQQGYYNDMQNIVFPLEEDIKVLELQFKTKEQTRDTIVYGDYDTEQYDEIQEEALKQVNAEIQNIATQISDKKAQLAAEKSAIETNYSQPISNINSECALDVTAVDIDGNSIFTVELLNELITHIKPTEYVDKYMLVTESMTYSQRFEKAKELMDRAQSQLVKISSGQKTYSIDTRSFLFNKQFKHFSEQLCAGAIIYVETKNDTMEQLHLTGVDISFDDKSTNFTLGNKYDRSDLKALYEDALGQNSKGFSELKYIAGILEEQRKELDYQRNWVADLRILTLDNVLTSEDQSIEINNRGLIGRKRILDENGNWDFDENGNPYFEDEQVKLIHNSLIFTKDNWNNAEAAIGKIAVGYNSDGSVKYDYGMNGRVVIGELILGNNLVLTGTGAGIKITDSNGNNVFYADDDGNLNLSGIINAKSGNIGGWNINGYKIYGGDTVKGEKTAVMQLPSQGGHVFAAGGSSHDSYSDCPFRVLHDGTLYATKGKIGNFTISTSGFGDVKNAGTGEGSGIWFKPSPQSGAYFINCENYKDTSKYFRVKQDGGIQATSGVIAGWNLVSVSGYSKLYAGDATNGVAVMQVPNNNNNVFAAGGSSHNSYSDCPFRVTADGSLYATQATITGTINANFGVIGGWSIGKNYLHNGDNTDWVYLSKDYVSVCETGDNYSQALPWHSIIKGAAAGLSDIRLKNDVKDIRAEYETFFDALLPKEFKYALEAKNGNPNLLHFGFVAQDILEIQKKLGIDNLSFVNNGEYYSLNLNEFIGLNTWQIQRCKARITDLENTVAELKTQIQTLTVG